MLPPPPVTANFLRFLHLFAANTRLWTLDRFGIATKKLKIHEKVDRPAINLLSPLFCSKRWLLLNNGILLEQRAIYYLQPCKQVGVPV